jgi:hypothetical protein
MIAALILAAAAQTTPALDWQALPALPYRTPPAIAPAMSSYVERESRVRRCKIRRTAAGRRGMRIDVAVLVDPEQVVRTTVPRAIACPTVEQYAAGLVSSFARNNLLPRPAATDNQWYRTSVTFVWSR